MYQGRRRGGRKGREYVSKGMYQRGGYVSKREDMQQKMCIKGGDKGTNHPSLILEWG